jgi:hypothetical protein
MQKRTRFGIWLGIDAYTRLPSQVVCSAGDLLQHSQ